MNESTGDFKHETWFQDQDCTLLKLNYQIISLHALGLTPSKYTGGRGGKMFFTSSTCMFHALHCKLLCWLFTSSSEREHRNIMSLRHKSEIVRPTWSYVPYPRISKFNEDCSTVSSNTSSMLWVFIHIHKQTHSQWDWGTWATLNDLQMLVRTWKYI